MNNLIELIKKEMNCKNEKIIFKNKELNTIVYSNTDLYINELKKFSNEDSHYGIPLDCLNRLCTHHHHRRNSCGYVHLHKHSFCQAPLLYTNLF